MIKLVTSGVSSAASPDEPQVAPLFARDISELAPAHALKPMSDQIIEPDWARPGLRPEVAA
jgi:hypothetical protein